MSVGARATFQHDFSRVRIHTDGEAAASARELGAAAYTVGRHIVFGPGEYAPETSYGARLIAHELTHVVQQREGHDLRPGVELRAEGPSTAAEAEAERVAAGRQSPGSISVRTPATFATLMRADPDAVRQILKLRSVVGAAIQFWPTSVVDARIGPVAAQPGLQSGAASRLNVIVGAQQTPRVLARELLPLWTTATAFTPPAGGPAVPPGPLSEEQLARALLVYNRYYLGLPSMTRWRAGLLFPLPADVDEATGIATVNPEAVRTLAASFEPAWAPALDQRATAATALPAAAVHADVTAFLAEQTTATARGEGLAARALTNAPAALPIVRDAFAVLGPGRFDVALAFMDALVNRQLAALAAQRDGVSVLVEVRHALSAAPGVLSATQGASLDRANLMLGLVAGIAAVAPSAPRPIRPEKTVSVDTVRLHGSRFEPSTQVAVANAIYAQCNVRFLHGVDRAATAAQTASWHVHPGLNVASGCGAVSPDEVALYTGAAAQFHLGARIRAFFVNSITGYSASGYSLPPYCATGPAAPFVNHVVIENSGDTSTLAHEIGHILLNNGSHPAGTIMGARPRPNEITDPQCATIYANA